MADFFLLITIMEGLPLVTLEAAAASLPVIASIAGGIPESVIDGKTGFLVPPSNLPELTNVILKMASLSPAERSALGRAGHELISQRFDLDLVVDQWLGIYGCLTSN